MTHRDFAAICDDMDERGLLDEVSDLVRSFHVTMHEACSRDRHKQVARARHAAWKLLREKGFSYPEIGDMWGVHHTTVYEALNPGSTKNKKRKSKKNGKKK